MHCSLYANRLDRPAELIELAGMRKALFFCIGIPEKPCGKRANAAPAWVSSFEGSLHSKAEAMGAFELLSQRSIDGTS